jgi:S1-C subfamily serine protease
MGEIWSRTFVIRVSGSESYGTGFFVYVDGREYLVTAAHVVTGFKGDLDFLQYKKWVPTTAQLIGSVFPNPKDISVPDIAVFALPKARSPTVPPTFYAPEFAMGEQLFFLGFPLGKFTSAPALNNGYPLPLVKRGIVSGTVSDANDVSDGMYLDAINNHGFSGGPVVSGGSPTRIWGVVSGFVPDEPTEVTGPNSTRIVDAKGAPVGLYVQGNSGLLVAYDLKVALDMIKKKPIGPLVTH